ncbi:Type 1 glutamine amidotransferase-like domain-containing protein [Bacillus spongiae]|uniref:Type 1 glutamine amidotransferase-like domain-containing protein n=1 Tax=Bacillus spongiae TaxID=2683610 RepID=A0ABU8H8R5_9BACI
MGELFLSGGGNEQQTLLIDKRFAESINHEQPLLYIPIAMDGQTISYESCFEWINRVFNPLGIHNITMWTDINKKCLADLQLFSAVYIGGGNTFRLLNDLVHSGFIKVLKQYVKSGGIIYGGSAGAIIFGHNIETSSYMDANNVGLREFAGLNLVKGYQYGVTITRKMTF